MKITGYVVLLMFLWPIAVAVAEPTMDIAGSALQRTERRYSFLMDNVVNAKTPGYREKRAQESVDGFGEVIAKPYHNFSQGQFLYTGRNFDMAIEGKGFFTVLSKGGELFYTRDGRFYLDNENRLATVAGNLLLMGELGPIICNEDDKTSITETGKIMQGGLVADKLLITTFADPQMLTPLTGSFFYVDNASKIKGEYLDDYRIKVGYVEGANSDLSRQLVEMPQLQKLYDANSRVIQFRLKALSTSMEMGKVQ